jgi:uncharacterized RDD family membrane protein YckC
MTWYYAEGEQPVGPIEEAQLEGLYLQGKVRPETLVWREGMANWQAYRDAKPHAASPTGGSEVSTPPLIAGEARCVECGNAFSLEDMIAFGNLRVCAGCKPVFMQKLAEGAQLNTGVLNYGGFWIRFGAKILDGLILGLPFMVPFMYFAIKYADRRPSELMQLLQLLFQLGFMVANIGYQIFFLGKYGATLGKMVCNLRVVTAEGQKLTYGRATGRCFAELLSGLTCDIGYLIAAFDDQKRALHDHICNTRVILK